MEILTRFKIHKKPISWNLLARKSHWTYKKIADEWKEATFYAIKSQHIQPIRTFPVTITIVARWKFKKRHDIDALFAKSVLDTLVTSGVLPDDSLEYVSSVSYEGETGAKEDSMEITIHSYS